MIEIPIFYNTDETANLERSGIDFKYTDCEVRKVTFYSISAVSKVKEEGKEYGMVHSNGSIFTSTMNYEELKSLIDEIHIGKDCSITFAKN